MKKFLTILILITLLIPFLGFYQVNGETNGVKRKVLMELFTATWCGPCAMYSHYADETYDMYGPEKVILLRNQIGNDGLDTEETNNRAKFYGVTGIPDLYINGKYEYHPAYYSEYRSKINEILKTISPISIKIDARITKDKNLGDINIEIEVLDILNIKKPRLLVVLFEKLVNYEGTNNEKTHRFVIRDYIDNESGKELNLKKGEKYKFNLPLIVKSGFNSDDFGIAAWVQDFSTLEVIQVELSDIDIVTIPIINPGPPELSAYLKDNHILLSWIKPKEGTYPINGYEIYKKINEGEWKLLKTLNSNTLEYEDYEIESGNKYHYYIVAFDTEKNYSEKSNEVSIEYIKDTQPPYLNITFPSSNNVLTNNNKITIIGATYDNESGIMNLTINEKIVNVSKEGIFTYDIDLIEGENKIKIISTDNEGNKAEKELKVICDLTPPVINLNIPTETSNQSLSLEGVITDNLSGIKYLKINNSEVSAPEGIKFTYKLNLNEGENIILVEAEDNANNKTKKEYSIKYIKQIVIRLQIGNLIMSVNDKYQSIDVSPQIIEGRTYLPIRWVVEPLGASVLWDNIEKKITILFKNIVIELWVGRNIAKVNGNYKFIDPDNPNVVPIIIKARTMLPIRFVAENLGCDVKWDAVTKTITIIYPKVE